MRKPYKLPGPFQKIECSQGNPAAIYEFGRILGAPCWLKTEGYPAAARRITCVLALELQGYALGDRDTEAKTGAEHFVGLYVRIIGIKGALKGAARIQLRLFVMKKRTAINCDPRRWRVLESKPDVE